MTLFHIAIRSLIYYWRTNLAVALGVAAATAVLSGALIVGDSMRSSLRSLTIERLGRIDELLISDGFFRVSLADEIKQSAEFAKSYTSAVPVVMFPGGTVEARGPAQASGAELPIRRAVQVAVLGITDEFWTLGNEVIASDILLDQGTVIINQTLADDLKISASEVEAGSARLTLRIPKQNRLPADSALGKQNDLVESLVDLRVGKIIPTESLGRFGMHPTQSDPLNLYLPIEMLQQSLSRTVLKHKSDSAQANGVLMAGVGDAPPDAAAGERLLDELRPTLEDFGLTLKRVTRSFGIGDAQETVFDYWSLSTDRMVLNDAESAIIHSTFPDAQPVFTYLANDLRKPNQDSGIPFSMVTAINFDESFQPISAVNQQPIVPLGENEIVLSQWAAKDIGAEIGETIVLTYFEPETTHGTQVERSVELRLTDIAELVEPITPFVISRRGPIEPATFDQRPSVTNDPDLTPEVPGVTDAESIENWDLPFDTAGKIRAQDDQYWNNHRTTPKAFVSLATGQKLWHSRFGQTTLFRIPAATGDATQIAEMLNRQIADRESEFGMELVPIKRRGLAASAGSTPFDVLFLALSMFVIGSAMILVSLLFRLGFQQRAAEVGLLSATGFNQAQIRRLWLTEMGLVSLAGAALGMLCGIGYAALMIWGLSTWWVGAISRPFLQLHVSGLTLLIGLISGLLVCVTTIAWSLRSASRQNVRTLLAGQIENVKLRRSIGRNSKPWLIGGLLVGAMVLAAMATTLSGEAQAGSFMGAGFLVLAALLMLVYRWLKQASRSEHGSLSLAKLAVANAKRNPLRSTLTIGLVAVASFLIAAVSAFRLAPTEQGTGGFDWVAQSSQAILEDISTPAGQAKTLGTGNELSAGTEVLPWRYKSGEDASCNNLYQSTQPRVLGIPNSSLPIPKTFSWAGSLAKTDAERSNPWSLLDSPAPRAGTEKDPIPVVIDKNTANYSLKIFALDTVFEVTYDTGETVYFRTVGFLSNTILQGSLIIAEDDFVQAFPLIGGYQYFLIHDGPASDRRPGAELAVTSSNVELLEDRLGDYGFDARSAPQLLSNFMAVQNTYLSTFQTLGALGLLLGTFGLAAVQMRSVLERKKELGLMRAVGFSRSRLGRMVLMENGFLLAAGLCVGIGAALFTTIPHWLVGNASIPWGELGIMFAAIGLIGLLAGVFAARQIFRIPLLESLRDS